MGDGKIDKVLEVLKSIAAKRGIFDPLPNMPFQAKKGINDLAGEAVAALNELAPGWDKDPEEKPEKKDVKGKQEEEAEEEDEEQEDE